MVYKQGQPLGYCCCRTYCGKSDYEKLGFALEQMLTTLEKRVKCGIGNIHVCCDGPVFSYAQIKNFVSSEY